MSTKDVTEVAWTDIKQVINDKQFGGFNSRTEQLTDLFKVCLLTTEFKTMFDLTGEYVTVNLGSDVFRELDHDDRYAYINVKDDLEASSVYDVLHMIANAIDIVRSRQNGSN